ncbi:MAG: hypothetical protein CMI32_01600 [Opitutales bacterium]|nr:hypothetical protein [Opitutales bacterium]
MEIFAGEGRVKLSVREFAEFHVGPRQKLHAPSGLWRARLGQEWHNALRETTAERCPDARFETSVKGFLTHGGWNFELEGRIDQMIEEKKHVRVTEVKTTTTQLPASEKDLRERYPHYFIQLASYLALLQATHPNEHKPFRGELLFVDVTGGFPQTIPLEHDPGSLFQEQADHMLPFLEERRLGRKRLHSLSFRQPFETLRPGQEDIRQKLEQEAKLHSTLLFEAPTGFGKTGILLEFALHRLKEGLYDRLLYLTGKATNQGEIVRHIQTMTPTGTLRFIQIRNQKEHSLNRSGRDPRLPEEEMNRRWLAADIKPQLLFNNGCVELEQVRELGSRAGVPPYEIMRACLPYADLWIGDYNYVFHPDSAGLIENLQGHVPRRTILVVDEAHNLPERVASSLSPRFDDGSAARLRIELREIGNNKALDDILGEWGRFLSKRRAGEILDQNAAYEANDFLERFCETLAVQPMSYSNLSPENLDLLWEYARAGHLIEDSSPRQLWAPEDGVLEFACLDASRHIAERLSSFGLSILMSATLEPIDEFAGECGLSPETYVTIRGEAPWRKDACRVAVDDRVDTRYAHRADYFQETTETLRIAANHADGPVVAFFPSYRYAEEIYDRLQAQTFDLTVEMQPRIASLNERIAFLENSLKTADVLLLILGSVFSEGIDFLGGQIDTAVVVGPALPKVNELREARMEAMSEKKRAVAFRRVYQIPGMRKVNQAIGRLIRQPGHQAKVLLHGRRFTLPEYRELLETEYRNCTVLRNRDDLSAWFAVPFPTIFLGEN